MDQPTPTIGKGRPILFGEVLLDTFSNGMERLGGAPFNVAWHLQGFGLTPLLISRLGNDAPGRRVLDTMQAWGMDTHGIQIDNDHPTGVVEIDIRQGEPSYTILPSQAYDFIDREPAIQALRGAGPALLYHGTLIARTSASYEVLQDIRTKSNLPIFVDVNLRTPWWSGELIEAILRGGRWAKMNGHELAEIVNTPVMENAEIVSAARELVQRYNLDALIVTLAEQGAYLVQADTQHYGEGVKVSNLVDTVGAGDAFSAVILLGIINGWSFSVTLSRALEFAAAICEIAGATSDDVTLYQSRVARWGA